MPLIELKTIKPVCDGCGAVGSTWTNVKPGDEDSAIPPGWKAMYHHSFTMAGNTAEVTLTCPECTEVRHLPENDSRA